MRCRLGAACHEGARVGLDQTLSPEIRPWESLDEVQQDRKDAVARECTHGLDAEGVAHHFGWVWTHAERGQVTYCVRFAALGRVLGRT